jgi:hypothetical protein
MFIKMTHILAFMLLFSTLQASLFSRQDSVNEKNLSELERQLYGWAKVNDFSQKMLTRQIYDRYKDVYSFHNGWGSHLFATKKDQVARVMALEAVKVQIDQIIDLLTKKGLLRPNERLIPWSQQYSSSLYR